MARNKKLIRTVVISLVIILIALIAFYLTRKRYTERYSIFQFVTIEQGDIKNTFTSTGIIHPRSRVEVGTQISGTFETVYADFNDVVKKGQLLAELDKKMLVAALNEAKAALLHSQEILNFSKYEYSKKKELYESGFLSEVEYFKFKSNFIVDSSAVLSANANLARAYTNLNYAEIISPIGGTVIERNVEAGQTVAANFNTPTLFVIAEDLSEMEIHAAVDESDISNVFKGQKVEFSVLAYPDSVFTGIINEIRLQPRMLQNVVNYIVVINADNKYGLLLPGMTATVDFIINQKTDVLMVSHDALSFRPPRKMADRYYKRMKKMLASMPDSVHRQILQQHSPEQSPQPMEMESSSNSRRMNRQYPSLASNSSEQTVPTTPESENRNSSNLSLPVADVGNQTYMQSSEKFGQLWYINKQGGLASESVLTGVSDDNNVEIVKYRNLSRGMQVISGIVQLSEKKQKDSAKNATQIFGESPQGGGGPPPPPQGP